MNMLRNLRKMYATGGVLSPDEGGPVKRKPLDLVSTLGSFANTQLPPLDLNLNGGTPLEGVTPKPDSDPTWSTPRNLDGSQMNTPAAPTTPTPSTLPALSKFASAAKSILPYASNIANSFRRVPAPPTPTTNPYTTLSRVNLSDERAQVDRSGQAADMNADRNLSENSAAAVKLYNRGMTMEKLSDVNSREKNMNSGIANQEAQMNNRTGEINNMKTDDYNAAKVGQRITQQNANSENLSNAVDKNIMIDTEKRREKLDAENTKVYSSAYSNSGVYDRLLGGIEGKGGVEPYPGAFKDPNYLTMKAKMDKYKADDEKRRATLRMPNNKSMFGGRLKNVY